MRPYVHHFEKGCGHHCKVSSWRASSRAECPACKELDKWWSRNAYGLELLPKDMKGKVADRMFEGVSKLGGHRKPETVVREIVFEMTQDNKELLAEWLLLAGDKAPAFVREGLEGTKEAKPLSTHAACAKAIKEELRREFPQLKEIKARASTYSGGTSVHVHIRGGCISDEDEARIKAIVDKYQYGHFDGVGDIYEYSNHIEGLPQVKYTFVEIRY